MIYPFLVSDGETTVFKEITLTMDESADYPIGEWRDMDGLRVQRQIATRQQLGVRFGTAAAPMEVHCLQMPKWDPRAPRWDAQGRAVLLSQREHEEYRDKTGAIEGLGLDNELPFEDEKASGRQ